jgi:hypothetical protein
MTRQRNPTDWCILWTSAARTLPLAASLGEAGLEAWTPTRIVKRPAPGHRRRLHMGQRPVFVEVPVPILPGFVFLRARHLDDALRIIATPFNTHPAFDVLRLGERIPEVGDGQVAGLREAEADALAAIEAVRDAETREQERQARAERLGTERAKRKALRQERKALERDAKVTVDNMPALAGMVGRIVESCGTSATIHFGGSLTMKVEAWQIRPIAVKGGPTSPRSAA